MAAALYPDTSASTKVAAVSFNCLRLYPARSITARPRVKVTTTRANRSGSIVTRLPVAEIDRVADDLFQPVEQTLHPFAHVLARNPGIQRGARRKTPSRRRTAGHVDDDHVEEILQPRRRVTLGQRLGGGFQELSGILIEGAQEDRFLVAIGVVKAATLDAGCRSEILHGRVVQTLAPEHIERQRDHFLFVKLTYAHHPAHPQFILDTAVKIDINVKDSATEPEFQ